MPTSAPTARHRRPGRALLATVLAAGVLVVPVTLAQPASATPCPTLPLPLPIPLPCLVAPDATSPPTVTGTKQVGTVVTATAPVWDQAEITTTYQWLRDGVVIEGATAATYTLTGADFDVPVLVRATGTNALGLSGTADSAPFEATKGAAITATARPAVTGSAAPGDTLSVSPGTWPGTPTPTFAYQWYRSRATGSGAELIAGATEATYSPVPADAGRKLAVLVTAERPGFEKGTAVSNVVAVPRTTSSTGLRLTRSTIRASQQPEVRVTLTSGAGLVPAGVVSIFDGTRRLRTFTLGASFNGTRTFKLARLARGTHRLVARYAGNNAHLGSESASQVLTVTR